MAGPDASPGSGGMDTDQPPFTTVQLPARVQGAFAVPHPFPYQGSKRGIAGQILPYFPRQVDRLIEPFCGSGAISVAAASFELARCFWLNDLNAPLMKLWRAILERPHELVANYEVLWKEQAPDRKEFFLHIRREFNDSHQPHHLLYLLARIVKGSVRYGRDGSFNQSPDNRRAGMRPATMRRQILGVSGRLAGKTRLTAMDYRQVVGEAESSDLVYLDPPYQGTSVSRDRRYCSGVRFDELVGALRGMNERRIPFIVSYDGSTGNKNHGRALPEHLGLERLLIRAGVSSQSVLLGNPAETVESLYLSPALMRRLATEIRPASRVGPDIQRSLFA
ncbi:MAG: DNA adenine methylase [Rhodospirillaceae bacterium]|nr:DNA adenine methylase [Rhodospirillaceae bacterium]